MCTKSPNHQEVPLKTQKEEKIMVEAIGQMKLQVSPVIFAPFLLEVMLT